MLRAQLEHITQTLEPQCAQIALQERTVQAQASPLATHAPFAVPGPTVQRLEPPRVDLVWLEPML